MGAAFDFRAGFRDFASRPVHLGYYLLAAPLGFFGAVPDSAFNLLSSFFAALTVAVVYALARRYLRDGLLALAAPLALAGNALFLENAAHAADRGSVARR